MRHHRLKATPEELLVAMAELDEPFLWSIEVAEAAGFLNSDSVLGKLHELHDQGWVGYRQKHEYIWWVTEAGYARVEELTE